MMLAWQSPVMSRKRTRERANRIRDLVGTARTCIIEIGRELLAAKAELPHGGWLDWLDREFGWHENTARNYMRAAEAFKSTTVVDFADLTIEASALYALSAPDVPQSVREEVVERAEAGERITKAAAEKMIAAASKAAVKEALRAEREKTEGKIRTTAEELDRLRGEIRKAAAAARCRFLQDQSAERSRCLFERKISEAIDRPA